MSQIPSLAFEAYYEQRFHEIALQRAEENPDKISCMWVGIVPFAFGRRGM